MSTWRSLRGKNSAGVFGFWVSLPGFDVTTATIMQMAFSSDYIHPRVVIQGTASSGPSSGVAPFGAGVSNGAAETKNTISFGSTLSSIPSCFIIASAPDWTLTLANNAAGPAYLNGQWHTSILETAPNNTGVGDYWPGKVLIKDGASTNDHLRLDWYACRVIVVPYVDKIEFYTNCKSTVSIKYLVLENR